MSTLTCNKRFVMLAVVLAMMILVMVLPAQSQVGKTTQRSLDDFLSQQGTYCVDDGMGGCYLFVPPDPNFLGWSTNFAKSPIYFAGVDYAGLANAYPDGNLPKITGTVTERALPDGTAEVTVLLQTKGANIWVIELDPAGDLLAQIAGDAPTLFGHRPAEVLAGLGQGLADTNLHIVFINDYPGAPLPDLVQINNFPDGNHPIKFIKFNAQAKGPLTDAYIPGGAPGKCTIVQTGLIEVQLKQISDTFKGKAGAHSRVAFDGFPAENINLQVIGK